MEKRKTSKLGRKIEIKKIRSYRGFEKLKDIIPAELFLTIVLNGSPLSVISCSPDNLIELAVGYLINNGHIKNYSDINLLKICHKEINSIISRNEFFISIDVNAKLLSDDFNRLPKFISSACGSIDDFILNSSLEKIKSSIKIKQADILKLNMENAFMQRHKKEFGGLHSAALFDSAGTFITMTEDIGRHNCMDKIAGRISIMKINASDKIIFTTGRLSLDAIYKIVKMKIPVVVTNSSITYSAAVFSKKMSLTAIGYARGGRFNIYSYPGRIIN